MMIESFAQAIALVGAETCKVVSEERSAWALRREKPSINTAQRKAQVVPHLSRLLTGVMTMIRQPVSLHLVEWRCGREIVVPYVAQIGGYL